jgi:hypothetical protein
MGEHRYHGTLIAESLRSGTVLSDLDLSVTRIVRGGFGNVSAGQPRTWTMIDFEVAPDRAQHLAAQLQDAIDPAGTWYCDLANDDEVIIVFSGRTFRYSSRDDEARAEAVAYGRSRGIPEGQLDWT